MKKAIKAGLSILGLGLTVALVGVAVLYFKPPAQRPASTEKIEATPQRLARGDYLVNAAIGCLHCHSEPDTASYGFPPKPETLGAGGTCFDKNIAGFPGMICSQNITSDPETGVGSWTDGEIMRAMREGVSRDGRALMPMMPYKLMKNLTDEDAKSIVVYIRTLKPIKKKQPAGYLDFPVNLLVKLAPQPLEGPVPEIDRSDRLARGKYLAWTCYDCHTAVDDRMESLPDRAFGGGRVFKLPGLTVTSANLTPHPTGMGARTKEQFISLFGAFKGQGHIPVPMESNTIMPWEFLANLTPEDLGLIYDYLQTVKPIDNPVERRTPPKLSQR